jgi:hypothetical protein
MTATATVNGRMLYSSWRFREKIGPSAAAATLAARRSRRDHRPGSRSGLDMVSTGRGSSGKVHGVEGDAAVGRPLYSSGPRRRGGPRGVPARCHRHTCQPPRTRPRSEESHFRLRVTAVLGAPRNGSRCVRRFHEADARGRLSAEETHAGRPWLRADCRHRCHRERRRLTSGMPQRVRRDGTGPVGPGLNTVFCR